MLNSGTARQAPWRSVHCLHSPLQTCGNRSQSSRIHTLNIARDLFPRQRAARPPIRLQNSRFAIQSRSIGTKAGARKLYREHPWLMGTFTVAFGFSVVTLLNLIHVYRDTIEPLEQIYIPEVAKKLKRAIYYSDTDPQPKNAIRYYVEAIKTADDAGIDPLGDAMLGVRFKLAGYLERVGQHASAIGVFEGARADIMVWVDKWADIVLQETGGKVGKGDEKRDITDGERQLGRLKRDKVLKHAIAVNIKLAALYSTDFIRDDEKAEERLIWAVDTVEKEERRRKQNGIKEGEGDWMTAEQIGGSFESLAHFYEARNAFLLSAPLFLRALTHCPTDSCHSATLMNNLATSIAQQSASLDSTRENLLQNATKWAEKALAASAAIQEGARPKNDGKKAKTIARISPQSMSSEESIPASLAECATASAVAAYNLASLAESAGRFKDAERLYIDARVLALNAPSAGGSDGPSLNSPAWSMPPEGAHEGIEELSWGQTILSFFWMSQPPRKYEDAMKTAEKRSGAALAIDPTGIQYASGGGPAEEREAEMTRLAQQRGLVTESRGGRTLRRLQAWWTGENKRKHFDRGQKMLARSGFEEGIAMADEGIERVRKNLREQHASKASPTASSG